jgi:hypothetical protein
VPTTTFKDGYTIEGPRAITWDALLACQRAIEFEGAFNIFWTITDDVAKYRDDDLESLADSVVWPSVKKISLTCYRLEEDSLANLFLMDDESSLRIAWEASALTRTSMQRITSKIAAVFEALPMVSEPGDRFKAWGLDHPAPLANHPDSLPQTDQASPQIPNAVAPHVQIPDAVAPHVHMAPPEVQAPPRVADTPLSITPQSEIPTIDEPENTTDSRRWWNPSASASVLFGLGCYALEQALQVLGVQARYLAHS